MRKSQKKLKQWAYRTCAKILSVSHKKKIANNTVTVLKYDGIGDFVLFLDCAKGLRQLYKDKTLVLSCAPNVKGIAEHCGYFDKVICFSRKELLLGHLAKAKTKAKQLDCELLLHLSFSRDFSAEVLASFINANQKVSVPYSYVFDQKDADWTLSLYDRFLQVPLDEMCLQQNKLVLHELGYTNFTSSYPVMPTVHTHLYLPNNYYVLFVGGSVNMKKWPVQNYYQVASYINANTNYVCVIAGDKGDANQEEVFCNGNVPYYSYLDKTDLPELQSLIASAKFVIGNDTSAIHVAASLGVPSLCVSSAASSKRFYPYVVDNDNGGCAPLFVKKDCACQGCSFSAKTYLSCLAESYDKSTKKCIEQIQVNEVIEQVIVLIKKISHKEK